MEEVKDKTSHIKDHVKDYVQTYVQLAKAKATKGASNAVSGILLEWLPSFLLFSFFSLQDLAWGGGLVTW